MDEKRSTVKSAHPSEGLRVRHPPDEEDNQKSLQSHDTWIPNKLKSVTDGFGEEYGSKLDHGREHPKFSVLIECYSYDKSGNCQSGKSLLTDGSPEDYFNYLRRNGYFCSLTPFIGTVAKQLDDESPTSLSGKYKCCRAEDQVGREYLTC